MLSHAVIAIAILCSPQAATKPAETADAVLFEGKLIGIMLTRPAMPRDPPPDLWQVSLQFQLIEGYCLTVPPMDDRGPRPSV